MKTISTNIYSFNELSPEAKAKAIENERNHETYLNYDWYSFAYDAITEELERYGYSDIKINFSGFSSQGDGASFTGQLDLKDWLKGASKEVKEKYNEIVNLEGIACDVLRNSSHYVHENTCYIDLKTYDNVPLTEWDKVSELEKLLESERLDLCKNIYKTLKKQKNS
mgnify:CR=1 FL=1